MYRVTQDERIKQRQPCQQDGNNDDRVFCPETHYYAYIANQQSIVY